MSKKKQQVTCNELRRLKKESQLQKIKDRDFIKAKTALLTGTGCLILILRRRRYRIFMLKLIQLLRSSM